MILAEVMQKTIDDPKCELDMALAWAVRAKNALQNCEGYIPNEFVLGKNVNICLLNLKINFHHWSQILQLTIRKNLDALQGATKSFI